MNSSSSPPSSSVAPPWPEAEAKREERGKEIVHRTKSIQFLGRTTPIILQNDNGPCPLLAICNVLSLKNSLNLSPDIPEVSQEKLLSLVAEHLIDSNSNIDLLNWVTEQDAGYIENQQQNIADAIDLLPRLTTGIDVNKKFQRIDEFEFTPECAIFDLLDIPLYHGWIIDPQDSETADAIGSKSYNTLMGELVSLEAQTRESEQKEDPEDDTIDFVAATTAALGVPSPCLSRGQSFNDSPQRARKGDIEEEAEFLRVLKLSEEERSSSAADGLVTVINLVESVDFKKSQLVIHPETKEMNVANETVKTGTLISDDISGLNNKSVDEISPTVFAQEAVCSISKTDQEKKCLQPIRQESAEYYEGAVRNTGRDAKIKNEYGQPMSCGEDPPSASNMSCGEDPRCASNSFQDKSRSDEHVQNEFTFTCELDEMRDCASSSKARDSSFSLTTTKDLDSSSDRVHKIGMPETFTSSVDDGEPIYEGEECVMESGNVVYGNREPVYEGEVVLAEQVDKGCKDDGFKDRLSVKQGELIRNFVNNSASQLTVYGLFCLQDKVKEHELCVFFRNNHFNTMFKYEGALYILVTDQGYINQPDLVWEKLNEVNGDTLYMMGNFKEFKIDASNGTWGEQSAMSNTADYLASAENVAQSHSSFKETSGPFDINDFDAFYGGSDLQLAIALQQQEFEQHQQQQQLQHDLQQPAGSYGSKLPDLQVSQNSEDDPDSTSKQELKSKEKCIIM
ncbi:Ubiquitin carboxyl-terminal hydrolase MINDY-2 [Sesamum angolense]|uniref:Ubiquitin carboxyl-terminal hydrolase MINDY-2 n=1 Tax=Sesamum angolense TaxID=2727404 RepID=A0AAE2BWT2_9LAMI|nr:Ubiquitin carboxyl-terminal hydrolase MINDY-2 [Sesamum angolense]